MTLRQMDRKKNINMEDKHSPDFSRTPSPCSEAESETNDTPASNLNKTVHITGLIRHNDQFKTGFHLPFNRNLKGKLQGMPELPSPEPLDLATGRGTEQAALPTVPTAAAAGEADDAVRPRVTPFSVLDILSPARLTCATVPSWNDTKPIPRFGPWINGGHPMDHNRPSLHNGKYHT